jgi:hypothetical protein
MNKQDTLLLIRQFLQNEQSDTEVFGVSAEAVFEQMPITLCEISNSSECSFNDLVRLAAHDLYREKAAA